MTTRAINKFSIAKSSSNVVVQDARVVMEDLCDEIPERENQQVHKEYLPKAEIVQPESIKESDASKYLSMLFNELDRGSL